MNNFCGDTNIGGTKRSHEVKIWVTPIVVKNSGLEAGRWKFKIPCAPCETLASVAVKRNHSSFFLCASCYTFFSFAVKEMFGGNNPLNVKLDSALIFR